MKGAIPGITGWLVGIGAAIGVLVKVWSGFRKILYGRVGVRYSRGRPVVKKRGKHAGEMRLYDASLPFAMFGIGDMLTETIKPVTTGIRKVVYDLIDGQVEAEVAFTYEMIQQASGWMKPEDCFALRAIQAREGTRDDNIANGLFHRMLKLIVEQPFTLAGIMSDEFQVLVRETVAEFLAEYGMKLNEVTITNGAKSLGEKLNGAPHEKAVVALRTAS